MSEPTTTTTQETAPVSSETPPPVEPVQLPDDHPLVKTLAAQKEAIKELKGKAQRLDEIEEQSKTELQKAIERAEKAERRVAEVEVSALRFKVAADKGVPANLLTGTTEAELTASADALIAFRGQQAENTDPVVPGEGVSPSALALNGDPLERALKDKLGIA